MEPSKLGDLPFYIQVVTGGGLLIGTAVAAFFGWSKKFSEWLGEDKVKPGGEAVVLNAAIADSDKINKLAVAISDLVVFLKDREEDADRHNNRIVHSMQDVCEAVERQTKVFKDRTIL